ncbi:hypothetical protein J2795_001809 [Chryseobacterium bernardetii]|uniref:Uncharacterized protein n=2 Tax=Chryseobacterium TaxID=59732 RepID=A0A543EI18_9FLAO|nr:MULTISPECIES: hypothetical protein [Chryseobacterium]MDR6371145.1 hypothetical protein [Chryseobacterium vietnamense]MDR6441109.1 hypothetical protein [Chryseobacterium bernardetii]TQM21215.1 hypothetical protein FB551_0897 [Chryseobacterium aquifrigidense]
MDLTKEYLRNDALNYDFSFGRLETIIKGLKEAIHYLRGSELSIDWWGTMDEKYEHESIYNLAILSFEHYLKAVITDYKLVNEEDSTQLYYSDPDISLIFVLAKYIKNDLESPQKALSYYNLNIHDYPVYNGIIALDPKKDLDEILNQIKKWRNKIITMYYEE